MYAARTGDAIHVRTSIVEIVQLADLELPSVANLGRNALTSDNANDVAEMLGRMYTLAAQANCEYLAELIDLTIRQFGDLSDN